MNSEQEKLLNFLTQRAMGASFTFYPEIWRRGGDSGASNNEPADLAWACNNTIILMNMTETHRSREKMFKHNIGDETGRKFRGWLKVWKQGAKLQGKSINTDFQINYDDYKHKILISVVQGNNATAEYHADVKMALKSRGFDITACATIPQDVLLYLSTHGGSIRDLLYFLDAVRKRGVLDNKQALDLIRSQHERAAYLLRNNEFIRELALDSRFLLSDEFLGLITAYLWQIRGADTKGSSEFMRVMCDLNWFQLMEFSLILRKFHKIISEVPHMQAGPRSAIAEIKAPPYLFFLQLLAMDSSLKSNQEKQLAIIKEASEKEPNLSTVSVVLMIRDLEGNFVTYYAYTKNNSLNATEIDIKKFEGREIVPFK